nr:glycosyltransferase family protein [Lachnospiraceae bacterium]
FQVDLYDVRDAESIYAGYNEAMEASDAKYKLYIHQDVFILDPDTLIKSLNFFKEHPKCGLLGVVGGSQKPSDRFFYLSWDTGNVIFTTGEEYKHSDHSRAAEEVYAIDGMFMMTQYDLPWRSDILDGWDMYDFSQSIEFHRAGYEVWVPDQEMPWTLHDCGRLSIAGYDDRLVKFLTAYSDEFDVPAILATREIYPKENLEKYNMMMELKKQLKTLLAAGYTDEIKEALSNAFDKTFYDNELLYISQIASSKVMEPIIKESSSYEQIFDTYMRLQFDKIRNTDFYELIRKKGTS